MISFLARTNSMRYRGSKPLLSIEAHVVREPPMSFNKAQGGKADCKYCGICLLYLSKLLVITHYSLVNLIINMRLIRSQYNSLSICTCAPQAFKTGQSLDKDNNQMEIGFCYFFIITLTYHLPSKLKYVLVQKIVRYINFNLRSQILAKLWRENQNVPPPPATWQPCSSGHFRGETIAYSCWWNNFSFLQSQDTVAKIFLFQLVDNMSRI